MNLHILTKPTIPAAVNCCLAADGIILINEAIYAATQSLPINLKSRTIYILADHWYARGGAKWQLANNFELVDYNHFVQLCTKYTHSITW
jgi:sulfur relay protein TusB/DsrH